MSRLRQVLRRAQGSKKCPNFLMCVSFDALRVRYFESLWVDDSAAGFPGCCTTMMRLSQSYIPSREVMHLCLTDDNSKQVTAAAAAAAKSSAPHFLNREATLHNVSRFTQGGEFTVVFAACPSFQLSFC